MVVAGGPPPPPREGRGGRAPPPPPPGPPTASTSPASPIDQASQLFALTGPGRSSPTVSVRYTENTNVRMIVL